MLLFLCAFSQILVIDGVMIGIKADRIVGCLPSPKFDVLPPTQDRGAFWMGDQRIALALTVSVIARF